MSRPDSSRAPRRLGAAGVFVAIAAVASSDVVSAPPAYAKNPNWPPPANATAADMQTPTYWPDDPGYAYSDTSDGQWNYYSFMIQPNQARPEETATGMSTDLAWRITTGSPQVIIAITDSGIKWDEDDIIEAAFLNHKELATHRPLHLDSTPCADLPAANYPDDLPADIAGFDCNGDGVLTVADYAELPTLTPAASEGHPLGDRNDNGKLDAGDLIMNFSDGIDDDHNGYVDDISGWDFMKDDNDPYDDTRYGHGTGEARDSMSRTNNGIGSAGGCPSCRLLPLRAGDSFITDATDFAEGVMYATDMHVKIVQSALGTVNNNAFTQRALDYAWSKGVLTIASMADENSRHHNQPTSSNHTLPVHAIEYSGESPQTSRTFLQYHPCSNYGGQNFLSASGTSCSSEATGQLAGISGLVMSKGLELSPPLLGAEAAQVLMMSADDIDVAESQMPDAIDRWSQKGFDQRFGYGRVNANHAVEMVRDGKIPPIVDITSPTWFSVLYPDQVTAPIDIVGTISAKRAKTFEYTAEWAPGVQPLEGQFVTFAQQAPIDGQTVIGADGPIASLDIRNIDPTHERDNDSPLGENDDAITVRVRAIAHYGDAIGDVGGELRRTYYVHRDPEMVKGFPIFIGSGGESSPKMADIDGDGHLDLLYATSGGELHVYSTTSTGVHELPGFPFKADFADGVNPTPPPGVTSYLDSPGYQRGGVDPDVARESLSTGAPAIADLDGDGKPEIVVTSYAGTIYIVDSAGKELEGWPKRLPYVPSCSLDPANPTPQPCMSEDSRIARGAFAAPVLEDMNGDGKLDIIQAAFDGNIYVFDIEGHDLPGFPAPIHYAGPLGGVVPPTGRVFTTPAVADFNGDGIPDLLVGSSEKLGTGGGSGAVYLVDGRGTKAPSLYFPNWPVTMTSLNLFPLVAEGVTNSGVVANIDGTEVAVQHGNASPPLIAPLDPGPQALLNSTPPNALPEHPDPIDPSRTTRGVYLTSIYGPISNAPKPDTMLPLFSQPALGDMDQDGAPDVIASGGSLTLAQSLQSSTSIPGANLLAMWSGRTGAMMPASPMVLEDFTFLNSSSIADLSGDGYPEAIIGSGGYYLHAYDACGREPTGWPKFTGQWIIPTPAVGDLDGDGKLEVAVGTRDGWLYAWHTEGSSTGVIEWESYHHDNRNTGNYDVPLDQGVHSIGAEPLTADLCPGSAGPAPGPKYSISGGCDCEMGSPESRGNAGLVVALVGIGLALSRRRK